MILETFKQATLGGSYGNPGTNTFIGMCVSYARKYMEEVLSIPTYPAGDAKDYWTNDFSAQHFDKVTTPQNGDITVYGAVPHNPYGHIGMYYNGMLLSQNLDKQLHVTIASLSLAGNKLGYLRKKGSDMYEGRSAEDWAMQAKNAQPFKDQVVASRAWIPDMHQDTNYIALVIDSDRQFKIDTLAQPTEYELVTEQLYKRKK